MKWTRRTDGQLHASIRVTFHPSVSDAAYALALAAEMQTDPFSTEREAEAIAWIERAGKATIQRACVDLYASHGRNSDNWSEIAIETGEMEGYTEALLNAAGVQIRTAWELAD